MLLRSVMLLGIYEEQQMKVEVVTLIEKEEKRERKRGEREKEEGRTYEGERERAPLKRGRANILPLQFSENKWLT